MCEEVSTSFGVAAAVVFDAWAMESPQRRTRGAQKAVQDRCLFLRTLQNELTPNQTNVSAKHTVTATRPSPTCPAWYFPYSLKLAPAKLRAITKNRTPTNSSHSWCNTLPKERAVARAALINALTVRLRPACFPSTRATIPTFRQVETLLTMSILAALRSYNGATLGQAGLLYLLGSLRRCRCAIGRGASQTVSGCWGI